VTLTPVVLNMAREDLFLVAGAGKARMLRQVLEGPYAPDERPAQVVRPALGEVFWMVDATAAGELAAPPG
jgi:6-phosphogluconolactonase